MAKRFTEYRLTLARERTLTVAEPVPEIHNADAAEKVVGAWFEAREPFGESMILLGLDGKNRLIGIVEISRGGAHGSALTPGDVLRPALVMGASAIVLAHNHPNEDATPSRDDLVTTAQIAEACNIVGLPLLDHRTWTRTNGSRSCMP